MTWGTELWDQFDSLAFHTSKGIEFCDRFAQFIKERCVVENEYAAKLKKLVKNFQPKKKEDDAEWTSLKGFCCMITEVHDIAGQHEMIADNLINITIKDLQALVQQIKQERKKHLIAGQKQQASLQNQLQLLDKTKKQYEKSFREAEKAQEAHKKADADKHMSRADVEKAYNNMVQKQQVSEDCKNEYAAELQKTNEFQRQHFHHHMPLIFEQIQEMEERRVLKVQELLMSCATIEKEVMPIINTCIVGMVKAAESVSFAVDSQLVIDKYKSGFEPPEDIFFEDLSNPQTSVERINASTPQSSASNSASQHGSSNRMDIVRSSFSGSMRSKRKTRLLNIFSSSKTDEIKEDYSHLPPNQQKKKLSQRINSIKSSIAKETAERDGMLKMQDVYKQNTALGDPHTVSKQLEENGQKLDRLRVELQKFERISRNSALRNNSISGTSLTTITCSNSRSKKNESNNVRESCQSSTLDQDSFDDIDDDDDNYDDIDQKPQGNCVAIYPFTAPSEGSISMEDGEVFQIMEFDQGDGWMRVRRLNNSEEGFVPTTYVQIRDKS
ncbi:hypothetical protein HELRODRAFT_186418 [Helobdella robusta]|uniref:SH3 domain-containing protein n=1 Tax=Helobdella robusta TaxID=6412 RepID=T1FNZ4_HELRO|nr:hypothetical protein HELRODRAFT_186418 [Helobdella robusta]ESO02102.1 hypothetical protein HELRODRAFT_186418 [Helobdella robusta]